MTLIDLIQSYPRLAIITFAFLVTLVITIVNYFMVDKEKMKEIRDRQKELKKEMKEVKNDPQKMMELNQKMLEDFPEQMKLSLKPMIITIIPMLILFAWLRSTFAETAIASTWIWWYIGFSLLFSITIRKIFGLQ